MINTSSIQLMEMTVAVCACLAEGHALGQSEWSRIFSKERRRRVGRTGKMENMKKGKRGPFAEHNEKDNGGPDNLNSLYRDRREWCRI